MNLETHTKHSHRLSHLIAGFLAITLTATLVTFFQSPQEELFDIKNLPIPFIESQDNQFGASLIQIGGGSGSIPVFLVDLSDATTSDITQQLSDDTIYIVRTSSSAETVPFDFAFDAVGGHEPDYFLYQYSNGNATQEVANKTAPVFTTRFPGDFGASDQAWINEVNYGNPLTNFELSNGITFEPTHITGSIVFSPNAMYALVVNETGGAAINLHNTVPTSSSSEAESSSSENVSSESSSSSEPAASSSSSDLSSSAAPDITLTNDYTGATYFGPAVDDLARGDLLRLAVSTMTGGDTMLLAAKRFDLDCKNKGNLRFPDNITVVGAGIDETHLFSDCYGDGQGSAYEVRNGLFSDLTFENKSWAIYEDGRTIEMYTGIARTPDNVSFLLDASNQKIYEDTTPGPFTATFDRVKFIGTAWTVYDWSGRGHTWNIRDSRVISGRQGVSMMSGGGYMQTANILRTVFDIDTMRSQDIGWTSKGNPPVGGAYGVVARGGNIKVEDSEFHMKCGDSPHTASFVPRCVGVYDGNDFDSNSSSFTYIILNINRWFMDGDFYGTESPDTYDIFMTNQGVKDKLIINGGCGSGSGCTILKNW